jgi:hypothetical protein
MVMKLNWQSKAKIMKACALLSAGGGIYRFIQKTFGRLKADPMSRIPAQVDMARWILEAGKEVEGKRFFEVGTGHCPVVPIGFFLCGAEEVVTVDLNRRLDLGILEKSLVWMAENRDELCGYYDGVAEKAVFNPQISQITQISNHLKDEGITCHNPLNAKSVGFNFPAPCCDGKDKAAMSHKIFIERMDMIDRLKHKPEKLLTEANT